MNKKTLKLIVLGCEVVLAVVAFIMMFLPAVEGKLLGSTYNSFQTAFGYTDSNTSLKVLEFSFGNFLTFIFLLVAIGACCVKVLFKKGNIGKLAGIVSAVLFIIAGVFFFLTLVFAVFNGGSNVKELYKLAVGPILAGIFSILAGCVVCFDTFFLKD